MDNVKVGDYIQIRENKRGKFLIYYLKQLGCPECLGRIFKVEGMVNSYSDPTEQIVIKYKGVSLLIFGSEVKKLNSKLVEILYG